MIFAPIAKWFSKKAKAQQPLYDISAEQIADLRDLTRHDGWRVYQSVLDCTVNLKAELLLHSRDDATVHETRGFIQGLRNATFLVDEFLTADERNTANERARLDASQRNNDHERIALYGSPAFRRAED